MKKTIEERAKAYAEERVNQMFCIPEEMPTEKQRANMMKGHEMAYIKIATEQKEIDKSTLLKVYADLLSANGYDLGTINSELERLEKAMEE